MHKSAALRYVFTDTARRKLVLLVLAPSWRDGTHTNAANYCRFLFIEAESSLCGRLCEDEGLTALREFTDYWLAEHLRILIQQCFLSSLTLDAHYNLVSEHGTAGGHL